MSTVTTSPTTRTPAAVSTKRLPTWRTGLVTGLVAAAAVSVVAAVASAAGVPFEVDGEQIPALAFAQMVLLGTIIGIVVARRSRRTTFVRAAVVLTALSCVPSVALGTGAGSKLALVATHVLAAAIIVPRLARPLSD
jgi:hypothetical protein